MDKIQVTFSNDAKSILAALTAKHNVLLSGPPSCGKTYLLQEVAHAFSTPGIQQSQPSAPVAVPQRVAIPAQIPGPSSQLLGLPSPNRSQRYVERIAFSANTRARDFTTAFVPAVNAGAVAGFQIAKGALIRANEAALRGGAALLVIDEMNRGPAVQLFGDAIVSIEQDKRLDANDQPTRNTWPLHILDDQGQIVEMRLSSHLYILAALNQADVSIEPLDVAFLRRFEPIHLEPQPDVVRAVLGASGNEPDSPTGPGDVVEVAVSAWEKVNERIALGRGPDFRLGHGIFLTPDFPPASIAEALSRAVGWWKRIATHVQEVFFGDIIGAGVVFNESQAGAGYKIVSTPFGRDRRAIGQFVELAPNMRPAEGEAELLTTPGERGIAAVAVDLQDAGIASQVRFGALTLAIGSINVSHQRWIITAPWSIVAGIGPELAGLGPTPPGIEHRGGRLVSEQSLGSS